MNTRHWIEAARLRTLPLAVANMAMGNGLAAMTGFFSWSIAILSILTAVSLQILSNYANDYGDSINGADHHNRQGPMRAVQAGIITSSQMKKAVVIMGVISFFLGITLLLISFDNIKIILLFIGIGLIAIWAAYNYTAGDNPYGYIGLGDISVFLFFGLLAVVGCYYLQTKQFEASILLPAAACGLLSVGVLNVNNIRDIDSDRQAGKNSIPVLIGRNKALIYHGLLLIISWACLIYFTITTNSGIGKWLFLLTLPLFIYHFIKVSAASSPVQIDPYLKQLALSTTLLVTLFLTGHLIL